MSEAEEHKENEVKQIRCTINPSQTTRLFMKGGTPSVSFSDSALAKELHLDGLKGIKVVIKNVSGKKDTQPGSVNVPHYKKYTYIPPEVVELTPEEKEKKRIAEEEKLKKAQKEAAKKAKDQKGSRVLAEKGILPKIILVGLLFLIAITLWYFLTKK